MQIEEIIKIYKNDEKSQSLRKTDVISTLLESIESISLDTNNVNLGETMITLTNIVCEIVKENVDLVLPILNQYYECILKLLKEINKIQPNSSTTTTTLSSSPLPSPNGKLSSPLTSSSSFLRSSTSSNSPNPNSMIEIANAVVFTMFGTISFQFSNNNQLLSQSVLHLLEIGKLNPQIQSLVFSSLSSESVNQASVLSLFINDFIIYSKLYPNYLSILSGLCQYNLKDFEKNLIYLIEEFDKKPESKASVLSILYEIAKHNPYCIIPFVVHLKSCLEQQSLCTLYGNILKLIVSKYPSAISDIFEDILQSISNITSSKFSLIQIIGMCGPEKTERSLEYLNQLLLEQDKQSPPDSNTIVSILKGMKSIQKTSPNLFNNNNSTNIFVKYQSSNIYTEFITTLAQDIIDQIKEYQQSSTKKLSNQLPTISTDSLESIDKQREIIHKELSTIKNNQDIKSFTLNHYQLIFNILELIPIPIGSQSDQDNQEELNIKLQFKFGNNRVDLLINNNEQLKVWQSIDYLESIVGLHRFLDINYQVNDTTTNNNSIIFEPFISSNDIKSIHSQLQLLLDNIQLSNTTSSPINNNIQNESVTNISTTNNSNNIDTIITTTTTTNNSNNNNINNSVLSSPNTLHHGQAIIFEGFLDKQSKYLKRYDTLWFILTTDALSGNPKKEKEKEKEKEINNQNNSNLQQEDETSIRISLSEILDIKEGEKSTGHFTLKRKDKADPSQLSELKSFFIITPKRKYLMKAPTPQDQQNWIQKLKNQIQIFNNPNILNNNNDNDNKKPNKKLNFKFSQYFKISKK